MASTGNTQGIKFKINPPSQASTKIIQPASFADMSDFEVGVGVGAPVGVRAVMVNDCSAN